MAHGVDIGAYYFPAYQPDRRNDEWHGAGWTEWELLRRAEPRFEGHAQPKRPVRGYIDDSDPEVATDTIRLARGHGIDFFVFDWHWYEDGPFLEAALEKGFLNADNAAELPFAIMWANQDWDNLFPSKRYESRTVLASGSVSRKAFREATDYVISNYLGRHHYYRIEGGAYFSIFDPLELINGLGGVDSAAHELAGFRSRAREAGVGEVHLNAVAWGLDGDIPPHLRGWRPVPPADVEALGFDSVTSYNWFQHVPMSGELTMDYAEVADQAIACWDRFAEAYPTPYYPCVMMGWDPSPRSVQTEDYVPRNYPFTHVIVDNTPPRFGRVLGHACQFASASQQPGRVIINAWNEWTEGSFLDLEHRFGAGYLNEIKLVKRR